METSELLTRLLMFSVNVGIFLGYVFLAVAVAPNFKVRLKRTKWGGIWFFFLCGLTHLHLALHSLGGVERGDMIAWHMVAVHVPQVIAVWIFVWGLYLEFVKGRGQWPLQMDTRPRSMRNKGSR